MVPCVGESGNSRGELLRGSLLHMRFGRIFRRLKSNFRGWVDAHAEGTKMNYEFEQVRSLQLSNDYLMSLLYLQRTSKNPLDANARKVFSQSDEDGITLEVCRRIGISKGACLEIGCGNGLENNTLVLLAQGWKTIWFDGVPLAFDSKINPKYLFHSQQFVTRENILGLIGRAPEDFRSQIDLISVDIDGNDGYLVEEFLSSGLKPSVFIVETNESFPPPIVFKQKYDSDHVWDKSRNFGWSLQAYIDLLTRYGYQLVACNPQTGVNAFFVRSDHSEYFADVPTDVSLLYVGRSFEPFKRRDSKRQIDAATIAHMIRGLT